MTITQFFIQNLQNKNSTNSFDLISFSFKQKKIISKMKIILWQLITAKTLINCRLKLICLRLNKLLLK